MKKVLIHNNDQLELVKEEICVSAMFSLPNLLSLLCHAIIPVKVAYFYTQSDLWSYKIIDFFHSLYENLLSVIEQIICYPLTWFCFVGQATPEQPWTHEAYLLFPVHLDGTLLDNSTTMKSKKQFFSTSDVLHIFRQVTSNHYASRILTLCFL